jgi:hypothetical protein
MKLLNSIINKKIFLYILKYTIIFLAFFIFFYLDKFNEVKPFIYTGF